MTNRPLFAFAAAAALLSTSCGPNPKAPVKVMAVLPDTNGSVTTQQVELTTVTDMTALKGTVLYLVGGNSVVLDSADPLQNVGGGLQFQTPAQRYAAIVKNTGMDVTANYIDRAGVLWPADFDTWNMVTAFYNFEHAYAYFVGVYDGADPAELRGLQVMYDPDVRINSTISETDNALYLSFIDAFVLVPQQAWQQLPVPMNIGIIGHETSHKVFNHKVYADQGLPTALGTWNGPPFNLLKSIDEGFADFHGYGVTCLEPAGCRPNFLADSLPDPRLVANRNVARTDACMDKPLHDSLQNSAPNDWIHDPNLYKVGGLWSASLYLAGIPTNQVGVLQKALIASYDDESALHPGLRQLVSGSLANQSLFTPEAVANVILGHIGDSGLKKAVCSQFLTRLALTCTMGMSSSLCSEMPNCPATASRDTKTCPTFTP